MSSVSREINREIAVILDRRGRVESVTVGDAKSAALPAFERSREAASRLRGLRCVHTHPRKGGLSRSDLSALVLNRLDAMVAVEVGGSGQAGAAHLAHLVPPTAAEEDWRLYDPMRVHEAAALDFQGMVRALEEEFARSRTARQVGDTSGERAILVGVDLGEGFVAEDRLAELAELARTAGAQVTLAAVQRRREVDVRTVIGRGKLEELVSRAYHDDVATLIFDLDLSPTQAREIEAATGLKVLDRTQLILDIFALHARGREAMLQVELAQLRYLAPRLTGRGEAMSRLGGGIGTRGPGESKLEIDRRRIGERIARLEREIDDVSRRRGVQRKGRLRGGPPNIAIIGYTNAGKSTLLNSLTGAGVRAEDKLFATLRPTTRRGYLPDWGTVLFTDTVGFIRDLPADLKRAFRATLEELGGSDVLLHVVDASRPGAEDRVAAVDATLAELGLEGKPALMVLNKVDAADPFDVAMLQDRYDAVGISATDRASLAPMFAKIASVLAAGAVARAGAG